jgi:hypothetical protein
MVPTRQHLSCYRLPPTPRNTTQREGGGVRGGTRESVWTEIYVQRTGSWCHLARSQSFRGGFQPCGYGGGASKWRGEHGSCAAVVGLGFGV